MRALPLVLLVLAVPQASAASINDLVSGPLRTLDDAIPGACAIEVLDACAGHQGGCFGVSRPWEGEGSIDCAGVFISPGGRLCVGEAWYEPNEASLQCFGVGPLP